MPAFAQQAAGTQPAAASGQAVYDRVCAACHAGGSGAPTRDILRELTPEAIHNALVNGKMRDQGSTLSDAERRAVAEFITGKPLPAAAAVPATANRDRKSTRLNSSHLVISYAVFCLKKKTNQ